MRVVWLVLAFVPALVHADEFGGWRYTPPKGYAATVDGDHVVFQKITGATFCQLTLFAARTVAVTTDKEVAFEWQNVIEKNFTASEVTQGSAGKTKALAYVSTAANVKSGSSTFAIIHYVVMPPQAVSSVLLVSNTAASVAQCAPIAKAFLDSLVLVNAPVAPATVITPAPTGTIEGRWATSESDSSTAGSGATWGAIRREYAFAADGTYRFHSEAWGGTYRANDYRLVDEAGTFTVKGDMLTVEPKIATETMRDRTKAKQSTLALEKVTYTWKRYYFAGIKEWNLVLTVAKPTARDGAFASNDRFPSSYLLSDTYKPDWKFPP